MSNMNFNNASKDWSHLNSGFGFLAGKLAGSSKGKGSDGLSARERAALGDREHAQALEKMAFGHDFNEKSANAASRRQTSADKRKHNQGKEMTTHSETEKRMTAAEAAQHKKDLSSHHFDLLGQANEKKFGSMNLSSGQATFREPPKGNSHPQQVGNQFNSVGSDTSNQPATPLDHLG